jgi:Putative Flp pilus-assembly TadE/G-like
MKRGRPMTRPTIRAEHGQIVVFTAVSLVALIGIAALSLDASYMYDRRNKLYAAADAAAKSAAFAMFHDSGSDLQAFANHEVAILGFTSINSDCSATGGTSVCVYHPPVSGPMAGNSTFVEVIVRAPSTSTFFGKVLGWMSASPGARAVAGYVNSADCLIVKNNLEIGNSYFTMNGCGVSVGNQLIDSHEQGGIEGSPPPPVNVTDVCVHDGPGDCDNMGVLHEHAPDPYDPLAGKLPSPPEIDPATCTGTGADEIIGPGDPNTWVCYNNIGQDVKTLRPGNYYITGTVNIDHLSGDDVFLYLTNECETCGGPGGRFNVVGENRSLHLTPHTTGSYAGVPVWQLETDTNPFSHIPEHGPVENHPPNSFRLEWSGAIYMPGVDQEFWNAVEFVPLSHCGLYIVRSLSVRNGNGTFDNSNCSALYSGAAFLSIAITE